MCIDSLSLFPATLLLAGIAWSCGRFARYSIAPLPSATNAAAQHQSVSEGYETTVACDAPPLAAGPLGITGTGGIGGTVADPSH